MRYWYDHRDYNEVVECSVVHQNIDVHVFCGICMPHAIQIGHLRAGLGSHQSRCARSLLAEGFALLTRPISFHYIERRDALEASANNLFDGVASGKVPINLNQCFALKDAADAHKEFEARATSGFTI